jgi:predicted dehydrogenase
MPKENTALLVGCGSIGKKHLEEILAVFEFVAVVDISEAALEWAKTLGGDRVSTHRHLDEILNSEFQEFDVATIANWGPDHVPTIRALQALGQKTFVVEKPLADSIADARDILSEVQRAGGSLFINLTRRFSGLPSGIVKLAKEMKLGPIQGVTVTGGARCMATNGIHYLDLATVLFGESPIAVTADLSSQNINPRHASLSFYEGTVSYNYPKGQRFACTFLNGSAVTENVRFYWRNAEGEMSSNGDFILRMRDQTQIDEYPVVTRTGYAENEVFRGNLWLTEDGLTGMTHLYRLVAEGTNLLDTGSRTAEDLLAALHSSETGQRVSLPVDPAVIDIYKHWNIS